MRKYLPLVLCGLSLLGCNIKQESVFENQPAAVYQIPQKVSYRLEDLCDTEIYGKNITLHVYIEDSNILWDYHTYKNEIFSYVKDFFKENQINCKIVYSERRFKKFTKPNEFGLEIVVSEKNIEDRFFQLVTEQDTVPEETPLDLEERGYAVTRAGIALINGWEEFRGEIETGELTIEEVEKQFLENYKGMFKKDYLFKQNAALMCHELLHCMMLFHPGNFPLLFEKSDNINITPNIMENALPKFKQGYILGYKLNDLQKKLIHSFIAGNNTYKAFVNSQRDLEFYIDNLKRENNLEYFKP